MDDRRNNVFLSDFLSSSSAFSQLFFLRSPLSLSFSFLDLSFVSAFLSSILSNREKPDGMIRPNISVVPD